MFDDELSKHLIYWRIYALFAPKELTVTEAIWVSVDLNYTYNI